MSLLKSKFFTYGIPFIGLIVVGSVGLQQFASLRYEYRKTKRLSPEELKKQGLSVKPKEEVTLQAIYEKQQEENVKHIDNWENIRGPRAWEEGSAERMEKLKEKRALEKQKMQKEKS